MLQGLLPQQSTPPSLASTHSNVKDECGESNVRIFWDRGELSAQVVSVRSHSFRTLRALSFSLHLGHTVRRTSDGRACGYPNRQTSLLLTCEGPGKFRGRKAMGRQPPRRLLLYDYKAWLLTRGSSLSISPNRSAKQDGGQKEYSSLLLLSFVVAVVFFSTDCVPSSTTPLLAPISRVDDEAAAALPPSQPHTQPPSP